MTPLAYCIHYDRMTTVIDRSSFSSHGNSVNERCDDPPTKMRESVTGGREGRETVGRGGVRKG